MRIRIRARRMRDKGLSAASTRAVVRLTHLGLFIICAIPFRHGLSSNLVLGETALRSKRQPKRSTRDERASQPDSVWATESAPHYAACQRVVWQLIRGHGTQHDNGCASTRRRAGGTRVLCANPLCNRFYYVCCFGVRVHLGGQKGRLELVLEGDG